MLRSGSAGAWAVKLLVDAREREVYATIRNEGVPCEERVLPQVHTWHISYSVVYTAWRGVAWQRTSNYLGTTCSTQQRAWWSAAGRLPMGGDIKQWRRGYRSRA